MATIKDIAEVVNLSRQTVSQVLRDPEHSSYSPDTRKRVLSAARQLNYVPNVLARGLAQGKTHVISMIVPWNIPELMDSVQRAAKEAGYGMMVQFTPDPDPAIESKELMTALERRVDGIIWMPARYEASPSRSEAIAQLERSNTGLVLLETGLKELPNADTVCFDYTDGIRQAVKHALTQGYSNIVSVTHAHAESSDNRDESFMQICEELGVESFKQLKSTDSLSADKAVKEFLDQVQGSVAFYCDNDIFAMEVFNAVRSHGLSIPHDVGIITVGDLKFGNRWRIGEIASPSLTSVPRPFAEMAAKAMDILLGRSGGKLGQTHRELIPMKLIERESTARQ